MKSSILLLAFSAAAFSSCTTAYKTGQTPDDVYYSAAKPQDEYVQTEQKKDDNQYKYDDQYYDNRYLRMKVRNRYRWDELSDWYNYDKYSYINNYYFGSYNNPFNAWNFYYNPYCCCHNSISIINPKIPAAPPVIKRNFSLAGYTGTVYNNSNNNAGTIKTPVRTTKPAYNNSNSLSDKIKTIFNDNSGSGSTRTYTPSSSGSSGTGSSGGSSGGGSGKSGGSSGTVTRPVRN